MEYFIIQKKGEPYVEGGSWCLNVILYSSETGAMYKDTIIGGRKSDFNQFKKGDVYTPKTGKVLEPYNKSKS